MAICASNATIDVFPSEQSALATVMYGTENLIIVTKSSPKNLTTNCQSTVSRQITDMLPTGHRHATNCSQQRKFVLRTRSKHDPETIIIPPNITYLPINGKKDFFPRCL